MKEVKEKVIKPFRNDYKKLILILIILLIDCFSNLLFLNLLHYFDIKN